MQLRLCPKCRRPYLAEKDVCPHCPEPYSWNQESKANLGCLLLMIAPLFLLMFFWLLLFLSFLFR